VIDAIADAYYGQRQVITDTALVKDARAPPTPLLPGFLRSGRIAVGTDWVPESFVGR
jgi:hypothetical protein